MLARQTKRRDCGFTPKLYAVGKWGDVRVAESTARLYSLPLVRRESVIHIHQNIGVGGHRLNQSLLLPELADQRLGIESKSYCWRTTPEPHQEGFDTKRGADYVLTHAALIGADARIEHCPSQGSTAIRRCTCKR